MSFKTRVIAFVVGIAFTVVGAVLTYYEFFGKGDQWYTHSSYFPLGIMITGIVVILMAFEKKKKDKNIDAATNPDKEEKDITV